MTPASWTRRTAAAGLAALALALAFGPRAAADDIDLAKVPAKITKAASDAVPGAKWESASKDVYDKEVWYYLEGTDAKGREVGVEVSEAGTVGDVETEIDLADAPEAVRKALKDKLPGFQETSVTEVRTDGKVARCDLEGKDAKGRFVSTDISVTGEVGEVYIEIPYAEAPKVVRDALKGKFPRFKESAAYEVRQGSLDGTRVRYDFEGRRPIDKEDITVSVTPNGKTVTIDE